MKRRQAPLLAISILCVSTHARVHVGTWGCSLAGSRACLSPRLSTLRGVPSRAHAVGDQRLVGGPSQQAAHAFYWTLWCSSNGLGAHRCHCRDYMDAVVDLLISPSSKVLGSLLRRRPLLLGRAGRKAGCLAPFMAPFMGSWFGWLGLGSGSYAGANTVWGLR